jgi:lipopolysaccharide biosynthesis protein
MSPLKKLTFHRSGKPRSWMRGILFDGRTPRAAFRRIVVEKSGRPRPPFRRWLERGAPQTSITVAPGVFETTGGAKALAQYRLERNAAFRPDDDVVVLVLYAADGRLTDLHRHQVAAFSEAGYRVALVVNSAAFHRDAGALATPASLVIIRENIGFDFGAWTYAVNLIGGLERVRSVTFTNDSLLPVSTSALSRTRLRAHEAPEDIVFLTANAEVKPHLQAFFFTMKRRALQADVLSLLAEMPTYAAKDALIHGEEVHLSARFAAAGHRPGVLYPCRAAEVSGANPTIHHWQDLLHSGFPFLKVQLFSSGRLALDSPEAAALLRSDRRDALVRHLAVRVETAAPRVADPNQPPRRTFNVCGRFTARGVLQSWNLPDAATPTLVLPFEGVAPAAPRQVLAVVHCFYTDVAATILTRMADPGMAAAGARFVFALTTDSAEKAAALRAIVTRLGVSAEVMVCPNRGRDVAPFLSACRRHIDGADLVLHLHTKKSPHDSELATWGAFLLDNLIGDPEVVASILQLFEFDDTGMVYSGHLRRVAMRRNWGYDYPAARDLLARMGVSISTDTILEFPTSTMFWARPEVLKPLLALDLGPEEFEPEAGQGDGTLAHAIERCLCYLAEHTGYRAHRVAHFSRISELAGEMMMLQQLDLPGYLKRLAPRLIGSSGPTSRFFPAESRIYPVSIAPSRQTRRRFNVLIPSPQPDSIYGGLATALKIAPLLWRQIEDCDLRIIVAAGKLDRLGLGELAARIGATVTLVGPDDDTGGVTAVALRRRRFVPLSLRRSDLFFATAWWTADLGFRLLDEQRRIFGAGPLVAYLIQDFEPGFFAFSDQYALADATYRRPDDTVALINSEELAAFMHRRAHFGAAWCLPYEISPEIGARLKPTVKEKIILVYGRPRLARNAFPIIVEGLRRWQGRAPHENCAWRIAFAGQEFEPGLIDELENAVCLGKMPLDAYADLLNRSAIGVALMISPHPSYPPLEMAAAGLVTITNNHESKDMTARSETILSLDLIAPDAIADALDAARAWVRLDRPTAPLAVRRLPSPYPALDPAAVVSHLLRAASGETRSPLDARDPDKAALTL